MSRPRRLQLATLIAVIFAAALPAHGDGISLKPFKDELFAYPAELSSQDGGDYRVIDYREQRDINERDEVPERRAKPAYVSTAVRRQQQDLALQTEAGIVRHVAVGRTEGARFIVLYLHGQGGSRKQGADDFTFGGNFNRLKNLAAGNAGLYLSPDFPDFGAGGAAQISALIRHYVERSPGAPVVVACGSMGGGLCWELAKNAGTALSGLVLLGSHWDDEFLSSPAFDARVPVFFGHGSRDKVFALAKQEAFYRAIRARAPGYPTRLVVFETGTHGTPIRMTDWRETLNWMFSR